MRIHVNVNIESDRFLNGLYEAIDIIDRVAQYPDNDVIIDFPGRGSSLRYLSYR